MLHKPSYNQGSSPLMGSPMTDERDADAKARRRDQILRVATAVFADKGYHKASISLIIEQAGIARGTFYLYFSSKHSVLEAILGYALTNLTQRIKAVELGPDAPPPSQQLRDNIVRVLGFVNDEPELARLLLNHGLSPNDEVAERVAVFYDQTKKLIERSLQRGIELGTVRDCNVPVAAAGAFGAIRGVIGYLIENAGDVDLEAAADEVLTFALRGVMAPGL